MFKNILSLILILPLIGCGAESHKADIASRTTNTITQSESPPSQTDVIVGDVALSKQQIDYFSGTTSAPTQTSNDQITTLGASGFSAYGSVLWPGGTIPVKFHSSTYLYRMGYSTYRNKVFAACAEWGKTAKIQCRDATSSDSNWLLITNYNSGCYATVGYAKYSARYVNLDFNRGCLDDGTVRHELGHVIGMMHEHQRPDRDSYIRINWANIKPEYHHEYQRFGYANHSTSYDLFSIMHYESNSWGTGAGPTYVGVGPYAGISNYTLQSRRTSLTTSDRALASQIYGSRYTTVPYYDECSNLPPGYVCP